MDKWIHPLFSHIFFSGDSLIFTVWTELIMYGQTHGTHGLLRNQPEIP